VIYTIKNFRELFIIDATVAKQKSIDELVVKELAGSSQSPTMTFA